MTYDEAEDKILNHNNIISQQKQTQIIWAQLQSKSKLSHINNHLIGTVCAWKCKQQSISVRGKNVLYVTVFMSVCCAWLTEVWTDVTAQYTVQYSTQLYKKVVFLLF